MSLAVLRQECDCPPAGIDRSHSVTSSAEAAVRPGVTDDLALDRGVAETRKEAMTPTRERPTPFCMKPVRSLAPLFLLPVAACVSAPPRAELQSRAASQPVFDPKAFFTGRTTGEGVLRVVLSRPRAVHVVGNGHLDADSSLVLDQRLEEAGRPPSTRSWHLRSVSDARFSGTLSDAKGPVVADVHGNLLHIRFTAKRGLAVEQWLYLQPGGETALNRMVARKFGIVVATLRETIRRSS